MAESRQEHREGEASEEAVAAILRRKWLIAAVALVGGVGTYIFSRTVLPKTYESEGRVFIEQQNPASSLLREIPLSLMRGGSDKSGYLMTVLQSDTMIQRVCRQLDLIHRNDFVGGGLSQELTELALKRSMVVRQDKNGAVIVAVRCGNPELCAQIVKKLFGNLRDLFVTTTQKKKNYLDKKIAETGKRLNAAEEAMLVFQNQNTLVMIDAQTQAIISQLATLDATLVEQKVEREQVRTEIENGGDLEELVRLRVRAKALDTSIGVIDDKIAAIRRILDSAPTLALRYARLKRDVAMLTKTLALLEEQSQIAAVTQSGEDGDYRVIDWGQVKREPVGPRSAVNAAIGTAFFGLVAAVFVAGRRSKGRVAPPSAPNGEETA